MDTEEFFRRWLTRRWRLRFKMGWIICKRVGCKPPYGSYGVQDAWCLRCGSVCPGRRHVGDV